MKIEIELNSMQGIYMFIIIIMIYRENKKYRCVKYVRYVYVPVSVGEGEDVTKLASTFVPSPLVKRHFTAVSVTPCIHERSHSVLSGSM